jgi:predicted N-acetyltransferase YhbS
MSAALAPALALAPAVQITPERAADAAAVEAVVARAFGPGRFAKVSYRVRDLARPRPDLSFAARLGDALVGTVRLWDVAVGGEPAVFLGPIAVDHSQRGEGLGAALVGAAVDAARAAGDRAVLLVGDPPFFAPFGFVRAEGVVLPGPVDPARVLLLTLSGEPLRGPVNGPRATKPAASAR